MSFYAGAQNPVQLFVETFFRSNSNARDYAVVTDSDAANFLVSAKSRG